MFHIRSKEKSVCPICQDHLKSIGSRRRFLTRTDGTRLQLMIRRLRCTCCNKIHHELPDIIVPYKHHEAEVIEALVDDRQELVPCGFSTIRTLLAWYTWMAKHLQGCIDACRAKYGTEAVPFSLLRPTADNGKVERGWLKRAVQLAVNTNHWRIYPVAVFSP